MDKVLIIAEAGVNHNGDIKIAKKMIDSACECGVDIIKFQTFKSENLVTHLCEIAKYQKENLNNDDNQLKMLKSLELEFRQFVELKEHCDKKNIMFLSTPFDFESIDFLNSELNIPIFKVPSGEITNLPYLIKIAQTGKEIILSTGMSTLSEVREAVNVLQNNGAGQITLLHCNTEYPTPYADCNLSAMATLKKEFNLCVGYSDHTPGIEIPIAATALGASIIEKHFTLDKTMPGPDHKASLEPNELAQMVSSIRNIEVAIGDGVKAPSPSEIKNMVIARKSIVAKKAIKKDEIFTEKNITTKRPGSGVSPMKWFEVLGSKASRDFKEDELIKL